VLWKRSCFPKRSDLIDPDLSVDIGVGGLRSRFFFSVFVFPFAHEFLYPLLVTGRADIRKKEREGYSVVATAMAEQRELEVTIISAQDLKNVNTFGKMSPYAEVWIHPSRKVATPVHTHGGTDPSWNALLRLVCEESLIEQGSGVLHIEILNHGSLSSREIGLVSVPLSQVIPRDDKNSSQAKTTSLQVCEYSCPTKGQVHCFDLAISTRAIDVVLA
jgi:hypothetical protein